MPISKDTPREEDAPVLARSLFRPTAFIRLSLMLALFYGIRGIMEVGANAEAFAVVGWFAAFVVTAAFTISIFKNPARLREVWRDGELTEVSVRRAWYLIFKQSLCQVERGAERALVVLSGEPKAGTRYQALVHAGRITVEDQTGRLRLGRLR